MEPTASLFVPVQREMPASNRKTRIVLLSYLVISLCQIVVAATQCTLLGNPPTGQNCGIRGRLKFKYEEDDYDGDFEPQPYDIFEPARVSSVEECAALCSRRRYSEENNQTPESLPNFDFSRPPSGWCRSFYFKEQTGFCQLGLYNTTEAVIQNDKGEYTFYDNDCFECGDICDQPLGAQLFDNGGFESDILGPWGSVTASIASPGHNSKTAYFCRSKYQQCTLDQWFNQCKGETYALAFDYKIIPDPGKKALLTASLGSYNDAPDYDPQISSFFEFRGRENQSVPWTRMSLFRQTNQFHGPASFYALAGGDFDEDPGPVRIYIDNVKAVRVGKDLSTVTGSQVFSNRGFESGELSPWKVTNPDDPDTPRGGNITVSSPGLGSKKGLRLLVRKPGNMYILASPILSQELSMIPGTTYLFSFDYNVKSAKAFTGRVTFKSKEGATVSINRLSLQPGRHAYSTPITAHSTKKIAFEMDFDVSRSDSGRPTEALFDNFSLLRLTNDL